MRNTSVIPFTLLSLSLLTPLGHAFHREGPLEVEPGDESPHCIIRTEILSSSRESTILEVTLDPIEGRESSRSAEIGIGLLAVALTGRIEAKVLSVEIAPMSAPQGTVELSPSQLPDDFLRLGTPAVWRELRVVRLGLVPWWGHAMEARMARRVVIEVSNLGGQGIAEKEQPMRPISPLWERLYRSHILNYDSLTLPRLVTGTGKRYIIISRTRFDTKIPQFAAWKTRQGYGVDLVTLEELGYTDPRQRDAINATKRYIMEAYTSWPEPPEFVLLVGDMYDAIPSGSLYSKQFLDILGYVPLMRYYDGWYALLDGPDLLPDVMIGRFPDTNTERLDYELAKSIGYEMHPYIDGSWQKNTLMTAMHSNANHVTIRTKREVADSLAQWGLNVTELYNESANPSRIIPLMNEGLSFYNYRGEWCAEWDWGGTFAAWDTPYVYNINRLCICTIISCSSADIVYSYPTTAELLLRLGYENPTNPRGIVAFVGSQGYSWYYYNNAFDKGFYRSITDENASILGEALVSGKIWAFCNTTPSDSQDIMLKEYTILGDPSLQFWTDVPRPMLVSMDPPSVTPGQSTDVEITVTDSATTKPLADALVCLLRPDDVYVYGYTGQTGAVILSVSPETGVAPGASDIDATITAYNMIPFYGSLLVDDAIRLGRPENVQLTADRSGLFVLTWSPAASKPSVSSGEVDHYEIYGSNRAHFHVAGLEPLAKTAFTEFRETRFLEDSPTMYLRIVAVSASGNRSLPSCPVGRMGTPLAPFREALKLQLGGDHAE